MQWILLLHGESTWNLLMQFASNLALALALALALGMGMGMYVVCDIARLDAAKPRLMCLN